MARTTGRRKCLNCHNLFWPDARNVNRQKFCNESNCRKTSKTSVQKSWLTKKENQDYFKNADNVRRVQEWRKQDPGYWHRKKDRYKITSSLLPIICNNWGRIFSMHKQQSFTEETMTTKILIRPDRIRKVPRQFNWIDGRLVRDGYLDKCDHPATTLSIPGHRF